MKIYTEGISTNIDQWKGQCESYVMHPFFLSEEGFFRTANQKFYKGEVKEGKHYTQMLNDKTYHTDTSFIKFNQMAYQLPFPHVALQKHLFHFKHITMVLETKGEEVMDAYYESRKTRLNDIIVDIQKLTGAGL